MSKYDCREHPDTIGEAWKRELDRWKVGLKKRLELLENCPESEKKIRQHDVNFAEQMVITTSDMLCRHQICWDQGRCAE